MLKYDFLNLSPIEFEELSRDLLQKHLNIYIESFAEGRDSGIDLRYSSINNNSFIIQCKRYSKFSDLKSNLKKEKLKLQNLNPKRYILVTSVDLTPKMKEQIISILGDYIINPSDIMGKKDLNNLLLNNSEIERKYYKLWLSSVDIMQKIINNHIVNSSEISHEEILKKIRMYVPNQSYNEAIDILNKKNFVIISGIPGIGKTTLAEIIIYNYLSSGYELVDITDINDAYKIYENNNKKQVFYYDDFLGANFFEDRLSKNEDKRLIKFMELIKSSNNKKLILTTREYILNQAKLRYEIFRFSSLDLNKCIVDLAKYSKIIKAQILYNHLFFSDLDREYIEVLLQDKAYLKIIEHSNYNPRVIKLMTRKEFLIDNFLMKNYYLEEFINNLSNPVLIWETAFSLHISDISKYLLYVLLTTGKIDIDELEKVLNNLIEREKSRFDFEYKRGDFRNSQKELQNTFITITNYEGLVYIDFQNPSIKDFLIYKIKQDKELIKSILLSAVYFIQVETIINFLSVKEIKGFFGFLEEILVEKFDSLQKKRKETISVVSKLFYIFKLLKGSRKVEKLVSQKIQGIDVTILKNTEDKSLFLWIVEELKLQNIDKNKIIEHFIKDIFWIDDLKILKEIEEAFPIEFEAYTKENGILIKDIIYKTIDDELESIDSEFYESTLEDLKDLRRNLDVDLSDYICELEKRVEQKEYNYEAEFLMDYNKEQNITEKYEIENEIENLFNSLKKSS